MSKLGKYFNEETFSKFFLKMEKIEKVLIKQLFFKVSEQVGENIIMPSSGGYFVVSRKIFQLDS